MTNQLKIDHISEESIILLVNTFYVNIRRSPELKDIFERAIGNDDDSWSVHLEKMYSFWSSLMLRSGRYHGNPIKSHQELPYFPPELFDVWLTIFSETTRSLFNEEASQKFIDKSQMIATTLRSALFHDKKSG